MKLASLTDRTLEAFRRLGFPRSETPRQCVLIEHEGAIICGAELLQTEGRRGVLLMPVIVATWISAEMQLKAMKATSRGAQAFASITGQVCLALFSEPLFLADGWQATGAGMRWSAFERAPDAPAFDRPEPSAASEPSERRAPASEPQPERPQQPEEEPGDVEDDLADLRAETPPRQTPKRKRTRAAKAAPDQ